MSNVLWKKLSRELVVRGAFFLPASRRIAIERRMRGKEEARKLALADAVIVSFGKSGRTWLRVMLSRFYQQRYGLAPSAFIGFDNLARENPGIPRLFFTHDNYLKDFTGNRDNKRDFYSKKVVLMVRDPRDTAVSQYFQWQFRMRKAKKALNDYPEHATDISPYDFLMHAGGGLPKVIGFLNDWSREFARISEICVVRYEDMRQETGAELARVLRFIGEEPTDAEIAECVQFASVENMRQLETKQVFWLSGSRMRAKDKDNPDSFKVRRAKVGGWRDYFTSEQTDEIERVIDAQLAPGFGYRVDERAPAEPPVIHTSDALGAAS